MSNKAYSLIKRIGIFIILISIYFWVFQDPQRDESGSIIEAGSMDPLELIIGDCYKEDSFITEGPEEISSVEAVPCTALHNNEIVGKFKGLSLDLANKIDTLNQIEISTFDRMGDKCFDKYLSYVGISIDLGVILDTLDTLNELELLEASEALEALNTLDEKYGLTVLYNKIQGSESPNPNLPFSCAATNVEELTRYSLRNYTNSL